MNEHLIHTLARELAEKMNQMIDIPFLNEEDEEKFFYFVILNVFSILIGKAMKELGKL